MRDGQGNGMGMGMDIKEFVICLEESGTTGNKQQDQL